MWRSGRKREETPLLKKREFQLEEVCALLKGAVFLDQSVLYRSSYDMKLNFDLNQLSILFRLDDIHPVKLNHWIVK